MKPVILTPRIWRKLRDELHKEHPKSVFLLRTRMKDRLGFVVREHRNYVPKMDGGYWDDQIHLDFYSDHKRTMFLLKWSDYINRDEEWNTLK